jgi:transcriptional regulator with XRE-family HTH domain
VTFGAELVELRTARGMSQRELAAAAGVSHGYLASLELGRRGHEPSDELIVALARALDVGADQFQLYRQRRALEQFPDAIDKLYRRRAAAVAGFKRKAS